MTDQKQAPERDSVKWWIEDRAPVDVAEAFEALTKQRDELREQYKRASEIIERLSAERDEDLAASAAREIAMRDRAAQEADDWFYDPEHDSTTDTLMGDSIRALPLSPDGHQALDDVREKAWDQGYSRAYWGGSDDNPHRTQPSDAGKSEDRG